MPWGAVIAAGVGAYGANKAAGKAADAQDRATAANAYQGEIAKDQYDDYKNTYRPLEHQMVAEAEQSDKPEAYEKAAGEAQATVASQIGMAKDRLARTHGLDPSSAAAQAANADLELRGAAMGAVSQNNARTQVKDKSWAKKMDALGLGKGLVTNASTGLANATAGANSLAASANLQASSTASGLGSMVSAVAKADWSKVGNLFKSTPETPPTTPTPTTTPTTSETPNP